MEKHQEFLDRYFKIGNPDEQKEMLKTYIFSLSLADLQDFILSNLQALKDEPPGLSASESAHIISILNRIKDAKAE